MTTRGLKGFWIGEARVKISFARCQLMSSRNEEEISTLVVLTVDDECSLG